VHYHPRITIVGLDTIYDDFYEFIEFRNTSTTDGINLSGLVIDSAIYYVFPEHHILPPEQYFVIASKPRYFFERYGMHPSGNFQRNLSNAGERVILRKSTGEVLLDFTYDDDLPWPEYADGTGASLVSVEENPDGDPSEYAYWQSSSNLHGSPFAHDIKTFVEEPDEFYARNIQVYPNPTTDLLIVQDNSDQYESSRLRIFDIRGALYLDREFSDYTEVSMSSLNLQKGIYLLEISSPAGRETRKIVYSPR
jgi:hypothetical protein